MLFSPVQQMSQVFDGYQQAVVGLRRISALLRTPTSTPEPTRPVTAARLRGEIEFADVHFKYRDVGQEVIGGITLHIPPRQPLPPVGQPAPPNPPPVNP